MRQRLHGVHCIDVTVWPMYRTPRARTILPVPTDALPTLVTDGALAVLAAAPVAGRAFDPSALAQAAAHLCILTARMEHLVPAAAHLCAQLRAMCDWVVRLPVSPPNADSAVADVTQQLLVVAGTLRSYPASAYLGNAVVVFGTLSSFGRPSLRQDLLAQRAVEVVVVDEAGQALEPETLIPLVTCSPRLCVLGGDVKQLPPTVLSPHATRHHLSMSLMSRMQVLRKQATMLLNEQVWRMSLRVPTTIDVFPSYEARVVKTILSCCISRSVVFGIPAHGGQCSYLDFCTALSSFMCSQ